MNPTMERHPEEMVGESDTPEDIKADHLADVVESRGEFATDSEVAAAFRLFGA
jgi:hypothetical protein